MPGRALLACGAAGLVLVAGILVWNGIESDPGIEAEAGSQGVAPLPPVARGEFLNAAAGVEFVGAQACAECHPEQHASWLETAHSRALDDVHPEHEPEDGRFADAATGREYRIFRRDDSLWHAEVLPGGDTELVLAEFPMRYVIGSGRFSRSYLVEDDGFLMESPCTWYTARPGWGLSPGYERFNAGFERPAEVRCVACHAGRVEPIDNSPQRLAIHAQAIDCERCHGPGAVHVAARQDGSSPAEADPTIAHPGRLSRELAESICAQCHFHGEASVAVRGRSTDQFRPGLDLSRFVIHYGLQTPNPEMTVVGHFEQMRRSACYQQSSTLTCTTCHDPHHRPPEAEAPSIYQQKCLSCHSEQSCGLEPDERARREPSGLCVRCHMPQTPTEIPHFAFTHHRIGVHEPSADKKTAPTSPGRLVPLDDVSWMPPLDQDRCLGLAYAQMLESPTQGAHAATYARWAVEILEDVQRRGLRDPEVDAALARLHFGRNPQRALECARRALEGESPSPDAEATALFTLGSTLFELNRSREAIPYLERVVKLRRHGGAWSLLSMAYAEQGDLGRAIETAERAIEISPTAEQGPGYLADLYRQAGKHDLAQEYARRAERLSRARRGR